MATDPAGPSETGQGPQIPNEPGFAAPPPAREPDLPKTTSRTGRNLPVAVGVGAGLGGLVFLTLLTVKATFLIYVGAAIAIALAELAGAFAKRAINIPPSR